VILKVSFGDEVLYPGDDTRVSQVVDRVIAGMGNQQNSWFMIAERRSDSGKAVPSSNLCAAVNNESGYGALIWFVDQHYPKRGGIYDDVWISDNPAPPKTDPEVISDPGYPLYHDPSSTIPISVVRAVVFEFCSASSGDRPESVDWIKGEMNGQRLDRPSIVSFEGDPALDWNGLK
jgi:hypothetical protein